MSLYKDIGVAISENTFDWEESEGGWPDVNWLVTNHLLRSYDQFSQHRLRDGMVAQVKNSLAFAIEYAEETIGVKIYRGYVEGGKGKKLAFITPREDYKAAKEQDYARIWRGVERVVTKARRDVDRRLPEIGNDQLVADGKRLFTRRITS